jgi:two-component system, OmpR family, sensor histidine kinase CpxA
MRRLFLRIFLAFWLAMAAVATLLIVSSPLFTRSRPGVERWQRDVEGGLRERLERSARIVAGGDERPGGGGDRHGGPRVPVFLLRPDGTSAVGSEVPPEIGRFARQVAAAGEEISERSGAYHIAGRPVNRPDGERLVLVAAVRRPPSLVDLLEPGVLGWRLVVLTAFVGALCFWLARTLTSPVTTLRGVVRRLAGGDLTARVAPRIAARKDEIGDLARDFDGMAARIEALVGAQRRLVRDVSHELRSPLARLAVALELARKRAGESAGEQLDRIELEAGRLDALIDQLLTLSRLEAADAPAARDAVDVADLVDRVADDAAYEASARGVQVLVEKGGQCVVSGDADALRSALENVVRNAVHFSSSGGEVRVAVARDGQSAAVRVSDTGPGVPEEHLEAVFQPFFRVEEARDRQHGGAGLGLAIAARAVRLHGGSVSARNRPTGGLEVEIRLPVV